MTTETKKRLSWVVVILWTCFIFSFSLQPLEQSSQQSTRMQERLRPLVERAEEILGIDLIPGDNFHWFVRKMAHFSLYLVLGVLVFCTGQVSGLSRKQSAWYALLWVFVSACADEVLQTAIPGRSGELRDVGIDTTGGMVGMILAWWFFSIWRGKGPAKL